MDFRDRANVRLPDPSQVTPPAAGMAIPDTKKSKDLYAVIRIPQANPDGSVLMVDIPLGTIVDKQGDPVDLSNDRLNATASAMLRELKGIRQALCQMAGIPYFEINDASSGFRPGS